MGKADRDTVLLSWMKQLPRENTIQISEQIITYAQINKTLHENVFIENPNNKSLATVFIHEPIFIIY